LEAAAVRDAGRNAYHLDDIIVVPLYLHAFAYSILCPAIAPGT
jgi:hypothetical protein